jgi:hypothetical protein
MAYLRNIKGRVRAKYYSKRFRKVIYKRFKNIKKYQKSRNALLRLGIRLKRVR